jgi:hypothetical protein
MRSKVAVTRISAVLFLGSLVVLLLGLTMSPRFANASGKNQCASLLDKFFMCMLDDGGNFSLMFDQTNTSRLTVETFGLAEALNISDEVRTDCWCSRVLGAWICQDLRDTHTILLGRVKSHMSNTSIVEGAAIVLGDGIEGFECQGF